jgi:superfamily II DNA or RNA helicase
VSKIPVIIDNRDKNSVLEALKALLPGLEKLDVATGVFEIGSFLLLEELWQKLDRIRILMGDETTRSTKKAILEAALTKSNESLEVQKESDDALTGLKALQQAIVKKQIEIRAYSKAKFHAKSYLMESRMPSPVDFAIVGSSNFTRPGLTQNLELNLFSTDQAHIEGLRKWYQQLWEEADEVNPEILKILDPHLTEYDPFVVYCRALYEFFAGRETTQDAWEVQESVIYKILSQYQRDGYHQAMQIAKDWGGALVCDGVGLGKTFIGLMILERCLYERKQVVLVVPKSAEYSVWQANIDMYLKPAYPRQVKHYIDIERHTNFGREGLIKSDDLDFYKKEANVIIVDEAHHFRNPRSNRGRLFADIAENKQLFMLTATPINNSLDDLNNLINYFARTPDHFARIRIHNLRKYFLETEKRLLQRHPDIELSEIADDQNLLREDDLFKKIIIQRSRKYVKRSEGINDGAFLFPERQLPKVVNYSIKAVYESLYAEIKEAFNKDNPFLSLAIYNTAAYQKNADKKTSEDQKKVVGLIRTLFLKRLESSYKAFEASVEDLLAKMARFLEYHDPKRYMDWNNSNRRWWKVVQDHISQRLELEEEREIEHDEEDDIPDFVTGIDCEQHNMDKMLNAVEEDMRQLTDFLSKIYRRFYVKDKEGEIEDPHKDDKLQKLLTLLKEDGILKNQKVIIFSEFRNTARYLAEQLCNAGLSNVEQVDSGRNVKNRELVIKRFSPYYNRAREDRDLFGQTELSYCLDNPIDILISTDVLSEGLNLQDASLIINYDLHWNPVRLMQRIGRVDRRLNPDIEQQLDRPKQLCGKVYFWNFLPPKELEELLHLKQKLDGKILRINKTLGIEGALLSPDDPDMALKLFNERYEGRETTEELMRLERQRIEANEPKLWETLESLPRRLFSGKSVADGFGPILNRNNEILDHIQPNNNQGVFACYRMPPVVGKAAGNLLEIKNEDFDPNRHIPGEVRWYFWDKKTEKVSEVLEETWAAVRCQKDTARRIETDVTDLAPARKTIEKHIKNTFLKDIQAPIGAKPTLLAWMEIN